TRLSIDGYRRNGKSLDFATNITKNWFANVNINFIRKRKIPYIISAAAVVISLFSLFTNGLNQGVDFIGGRSYNVQFEKEVDAHEMEERLIETFGSAEAKTYGANNQLKITTNYKVDEEGDEIEDEIQDQLYQTLKSDLPSDMSVDQFKKADPETGIGILSSIKVGPSIADDIKTASYWAVLASLIGVFLYILFRFRGWQFSTGAVAGLLHDTIIVMGVFSLFQNIMPFSLEVDQSFIAGILTVVGYSINDT